MLSLPCTAYDRILLCLFLVFLTLFWPFLSFQIHPKLIYREMGWEEGCRYKILGYRIQFEGKTLYVFDLNVPEVFLEKKRKKKTDDDIKASEPATVQAEEQPEVNTRKGYYPDDIANTFGVSVEQHREETAFHHMDGYVSVGVLTGSPDRRGEAQGQRPFAVPDAGD